MWRVRDNTARFGSFNCLSNCLWSFFAGPLEGRHGTQRSVREQSRAQVCFIMFHLYRSNSEQYRTIKYNKIITYGFKKTTEIVAKKTCQYDSIISGSPVAMAPPQVTTFQAFQATRWSGGYFQPSHHDGSSSDPMIPRFLDIDFWISIWISIFGYRFLDIDFWISIFGY